MSPSIRIARHDRVGCDHFPSTSSRAFTAVLASSKLSATSACPPQTESAQNQWPACGPAWRRGFGRAPRHRRRAANRHRADADRAGSARGPSFCPSDAASCQLACSRSFTIPVHRIRAAARSAEPCAPHRTHPSRGERLYAASPRPRAAGAVSARWWCLRQRLRLRQHGLASEGSSGLWRRR